MKAVVTAAPATMNKCRVRRKTLKVIVNEPSTWQLILMMIAKVAMRRSQYNGQQISKQECYNLSINEDRRQYVEACLVHHKNAQLSSTLLPLQRRRKRLFKDAV